MKRQYKRRCKACGRTLQKNGKENNKQRWRCPSRGTSMIHQRPDLSGNWLLLEFRRYLLGFTSLKDLSKAQGITIQSLVKRFEPCWDFIPKPALSGEVLNYIVIDAKRVNNLVVAIIMNTGAVVNWVWGVSETSAIWLEVLNTIPEPLAVVTDGQRGILKALDHLWPNIAIQRCHFHIKRNIRAKLTNNPESPAGQDLKWLMSYLCKARYENDALWFVGTFYSLYDTHLSFINERTINHNPLVKRKWWYTHGRVRSAYKQIANLVEQDQLFAYITHPRLNLPNTTNMLEGGINSRLDELLLRHRGLTQVHQQRLVDWYLISRTKWRGDYTKKFN